MTNMMDRQATRVEAHPSWSARARRLRRYRGRTVGRGDGGGCTHFSDAWDDTDCLLDLSRHPTGVRSTGLARVAFFAGCPGFSRDRHARMVMMHRMILALGLSIVAVGCTLGKADDGPWMP